MLQEEMPPPLQKTPPQSSSKSKPNSETPRKPPLASNPSYQSGNLEQQRDATMEDIGFLPIVSINFLLDSALPSMDDSVCRKVEQMLQKNGQLGAKGRWKQYPSAPGKSKKKESDVFKPLIAIFDAIVKAGSEVLGRPATLEFKQDPDVKSHGERENSSKPDGRFTLRSPDPVIALHGDKSWFSTALACEFKKAAEAEVIDNMRKVLWSCRHILCNDPRRRFTFGLTFDDTETRVYFVCRSYVIVTEPFNFITDPSTLIKVLLALAFADEEQLGFDTTMSQLMDENDTIQYKMMVGNKTYITRCPLVDYAADGIRGRGTRVWEAYEEGIPDILVVIKDVWIHSDAITEGDQLRALRSHLAVATQARESTGDHFLTVLEDCLVTLRNGTADDTLAVMMRGKTVPLDAELMPLTAANQIAKKPIQTGSTRLPSTKSSAKTLRSGALGLPSSMKASQAVMPLFNRRKHSRIVFQEVGKPIYELESLLEVTQALTGAIRALKFLHDLGLVHRDVTPANILLVDGTGKLSDLEYLKPFKHELQDTVSDLCVGPEDSVVVMAEAKTGIREFLPVEVQLNRYMFTPAIHADRMGNVSDVEPITTPFYTLPLHDLESIFWILVWIVVHRQPQPSDTVHCTHSHRTTLVEQLFGPVALRQAAIQQDPFRVQQFPDPFRPLVTKLLKLRRHLYSEYALYEGNQSLHDLNFDIIHAHFIEACEVISPGSLDVRFLLTEVSKRPLAQSLRTGNSRASGGKRRKSSPPPSPDSNEDDIIIEVGASGGTQNTTRRSSRNKKARTGSKH
ncbi:hypothetical protein C8J57DRAFT_1154475 [Mycena rebaudengoi]|nr:hypothetical protein C8J57DRAFT_1154475 [Mycena rebaudengoi]